MCLYAYMSICFGAVAERIKEVGYENITYIAVLRDWVRIMATRCIAHRYNIAL